MEKLKQFLMSKRLVLAQAIADKKLLHSRDIQLLRTMKNQQIMQHEQQQQNIEQQQINDNKIRELNGKILSQKMVICDQDNDNDGLIDEKRDNEATNLIGPTDGISDLNAFLDFYKLNVEDLKEHWELI